MVKKKSMRRRHRRVRRTLRLRRGRGGGTDGIIIGKMKCGLGNQLFIYAACVAVQQKFPYSVQLFNDTCNNSTTKEYRPLFKNATAIDTVPPETSPNTYSYNDIHLDLWDVGSIPPATTTIIINSLFHSLPTIRAVIPIVCDALVKELSVRYPTVSATPQSGFIHVRRGDYMNAPWNGNFNILDTATYYNPGIKATEAANPSLANWYIFSDDISYCKEQTWDTKLPVIFHDSPDELECLYLMSQCKAGAIVANSTYSWWGGMLACGLAGNVVRPKIYFKWANDTPNLYPDTWIAI